MKGHGLPYFSQQFHVYKSLLSSCTAVQIKTFCCRTLQNNYTFYCVLTDNGEVLSLAYWRKHYSSHNLELTCGILTLKRVCSPLRLVNLTAIYS